MILLDTNVVSKPLRPDPDPRVLAWIDAQAIETLFLSAVTVAELRFGITSLPPGERREPLHRRLEAEVLPLFEHRAKPKAPDFRAWCRNFEMVQRPRRSRACPRSRLMRQHLGPLV